MHEQHCGRPSDVYDTRRQTKLTAPETITRWLILKKRKNGSLSHPLGHLGITYALHLWLVGKPVVDFIFIIIELFRYLLRLRRYERKSVEVSVFRRGWVTLNADFRVKGASTTNHSWYQSSSDCPFVRYQNICDASFSFVTIHACDRETDRQTDRRTDRITTPKTALAYARAVKILDRYCMTWPHTRELALKNIVGALKVTTLQLQQ